MTSFGNICNQSCSRETGSGPHYCPDDACSRLPRLGCVWAEACELYFVCVCNICQEEVKCLCAQHDFFHRNHTLLKRHSSLNLNQLVMEQNKHNVAPYYSNDSLRWTFSYIMYMLRQKCTLWLFSGAEGYDDGDWRRQQWNGVITGMGGGGDE